MQGFRGTRCCSSHGIERSSGVEGSRKPLPPCKRLRDGLAQEERVLVAVAATVAGRLGE